MAIRYSSRCAEISSVRALSLLPSAPEQERVQIVRRNYAKSTTVWPLGGYFFEFSRDDVPSVKSEVGRWPALVGARAFLRHVAPPPTHVDRTHHHAPRC